MFNNYLQNRMAVIATAILLSACGGTNQTASIPTKVSDLLTLIPAPVTSAIDQTELAPLDDLVDPVAAGKWDTSTVSPDGTVIAFTVYAPTIPRGNAAPLILEGHGWGGKRTRNLDTTAFADEANTPLQTAKLALDAGIQGGKSPNLGWYVISFDQRGFGESGGLANVMDPTKEGKDVSAILDWAQSHLTRLAYRKNAKGVKNPVIGAVGLSYGGGYQTIGAGVDKRFNALVPTTTWNDLRYSIYNLPKSEYLSLLVGVGAAGMGHAEPFTYQAFVDASTTNQVSADFSQKMYLHSPVSYCTGTNPDMVEPGIPAFFIQGSNDILFNLNEAFDSFECYRKANPGSKFMAVRFGHPDVLINNSMPKFTEENIACGGPTSTSSISVGRLAFSFLTQNLIGSKIDSSYSADYLTVPDLRAILEDGNASGGPKGETAEHQCYEVASLGSVPANGQVFTRGGTNFPVTPASIQNVVAGAPAPLVSLIKPNDPATLAEPAMTAFTGPDAGTVVPLTTALGTDRMLLGTPTVHVNIASSTGVDPSSVNPPILFVGIVRKTASGASQLVHDQVQPVVGFGAHDITLPGISLQLHASDSLALVVFGYHPQYFNFYSKVPVTVNVTDISAGIPFIGS